MDKLSDVNRNPEQACGEVLWLISHLRGGEDGGGLDEMMACGVAASMVQAAAIDRLTQALFSLGTDVEKGCAALVLHR